MKAESKICAKVLCTTMEELQDNFIEEPPSEGKPNQNKHTTISHSKAVFLEALATFMSMYK